MIRSSLGLPDEMRNPLDARNETLRDWNFDADCGYGNVKGLVDRRTTPRTTPQTTPRTTPQTTQRGTGASAAGASALPPQVPLPMGKGSVGGGAAGRAHGVDEHDDAREALLPNTRQAAEQALRVGGTGFYESGRPSFLLHPLRSANASGHTRMPAMERSATSGRDSQRPRLGSAPQARGAATTHAASAAPKHRGPPKGKDASAGRDPDKDLQARDDVDDDGGD